MILTNLNAISRYERMRRRLRPIIDDLEDVASSEVPETVEEDEGSHGVPVKRRPGEAARQAYRRRRELLAPERRRWPRNGGKSRRERLGRVVDILV